MIKMKRYCTRLEEWHILKIKRMAKKKGLKDAEFIRKVIDKLKE